MNYAIIVAGGKGKRFSDNRKKQFYSFHGKTILELTVEKFSNHEKIGEIILVLPKDDLQNYYYLIEKFPKIKSIVPGGTTRFKSVFNGLQAIESDFGDNDNVLIHDGVRPLVTEALIDKILIALKDNSCVVPGIKMEDTVKKIDAENFVTSTVEREKLFRIQTPQGFKKEIFPLFKKYETSNEIFTDDASLFEYAGYNVKIVEGDKSNIKITTKEDLQFLKLYYGDSMNVKIGFGYDVHRFSNNRKLILGGVEIPYEKGLAGHSDADVVVHAIMDAIIGALALGDIGEHFPDNNPEFKNINSLMLLKKIYNDFLKNSFDISNIDVTIVCEKPKVKDFKESMKKNISCCLNIPEDCVNIKATTTEGLGFSGREEGIAAYSVVVISPV